MDDYSRRIADHRFEEAHRRALVSGLIATLRRQPNEMLSFAEVRTRLNVRGQRYLGLQVVPLANIVGSEGRYEDFDRSFLPRSRATKGRWMSISNALQHQAQLPPVELFKIGDIYFVRDGNHRVSAARTQGQEYIDAVVTELVVDVPLDPDISFRDLILKEEYSDFLEWTDLHSLRPDERIEFSEPGGYLDLVRHINAHRYYMGLGREAPVERDEAVADWYDSVYVPVVRAIREQGALEHFPGRTEADLYRWIMDHRWYMREHSGVDPGPEQAAQDYVRRFGHSELEIFVRDLIGRLARRPG
jgi:hypothetical protein